METRSETERGGRYDSSTPPAPVEQASVFEDFIDVFYAPSKVFARRANGGFGIQLLIIVVLSAFFAFASKSVFSQIFDAEFSRATAKAVADNPRITQDQMNAFRPMQEKIATAFIYLAPLFVVFFTSVVVWVATKVISAKVSFGQSMMVTTLAYIPRLVGGLVGVLQVVLMDTTNFTNRFSLSASPARFADPDTMNPKLFAILGSLDLFAIWSAVLIGIGLAVVGKVSRSKGYLAAAGVFVLFTLLGAAFAR